MQGNWAVLFLLVVAVVLFALVKSRQKPEDADGQGEETAGMPDGGREPDATPEPESTEVPWEDCQRQLDEEPSLGECEQVEFLPFDEADMDPNLVPETEVEPVYGAFPLRVMLGLVDLDSDPQEDDDPSMPGGDLPPDNPAQDADSHGDAGR
jgi:hypothetical protein